MHEPIDSFENRLRKALNYRGMKPIDLANKLDLNKGIISQYLKGKYYPKQKRLSENNETSKHKRNQRKR